VKLDSATATGGGRTGGGEVLKKAKKDVRKVTLGGCSRLVENNQPDIIVLKY
jgi:hypothetical protein